MRNARTGPGSFIGAALIVGALALAAAPRAGAQTPPASATPPASEASPAQQPTGGEPGQYWYDLAQLHQRYDMTDDAAKCYSKAIESATSPQIKAQALSSWGEMLEREKQPADAADKFAQAEALAVDPQTKWRVGSSLARMLENAGQNDEASTQYQLLMKTAEKPGQREWARDRLCDLYRRLQKTDDLIRIFETLSTSDPKDALALQTLVWIYRDWKGDLPLARAAAVKLLALRGDDPQAVYQLADIEVRLHETEQAVALYEKLGGSQPAQRATCYERIANAYFQSDQKDKGLEWSEKTAQVEPQNWNAWTRYGDICCNYGETARSLPAYAKADSFAKTEGDHDQVKLHLANAYRGLKRDAEAIAIYKELFAKPTSPVRDQAKRELFELYSERGLLDKVEINLAEPAPATTGN